MSQRSLILIGCILTAMLSAAIAQPGTRGTQYALLISVSKYAKTDQWRTLKYTIDEMEEFRDVLTKTGFAAENIVFLHDRQTDEKLRPTGANIFKKLDLLLTEIGADDTLLIAFNGHGVQFGGDMTGYFAPVNADLNDKKTLVAMDGTNSVYDRLEQCKARKKLLIVNACRNDPTEDPTFAAKKYNLVDKEDRDPPKGTAALFSCKPGQKSYEYPSDQNRKRSVFYHHLIEAWKGTYADGEKVSLDHVFDAVTRKTAADARNIFSQPQTPWPRRKYEGEWVLTKASPNRPAPPLESAKKVGQSITNSLGMEMMYIPPGKFQMGSPQNVIADLKKEYKVDYFDWEGPQHEVTITKEFYLGKYEVTQGEYQAVMGKNPSWFSKDGDGKEKVGNDTSRFPVEQVSWEEAKEFCRKLTQKERNAGKLKANEEYRLPTEAEWEYACRGGTKEYKAFHYGDSLSSTQANFNGEYPHGGAAKGKYLARTETVGSYQKNGYGLYDMHGNVWEWCEDWFDEKEYQRGDCKDPSGPLKGTSRVMRGGSWHDSARGCRSACRDGFEPVYRSPDLGFRLARSSVK